MTDKHWSYQQITEAAERSIRSTLKLASAAKAEGDLPTADVFYAFAHGHWSFWNALTMGWQTDDASGRLAALIREARHAEP